MIRMRTALALALLIAAAGCSGDSSPTGTDGPVAFTEVFRDKSSGITQKRAEVISRPEEWQRVWDEIMSTRSPRPALPNVNFDNSILIVAALGNLGDACKHVRVDGVHRRGGTLEVTISEVRPPASCVCPPVTVQPVHVVAVPRAATGATYTWRTLTEGPPCN